MLYNFILLCIILFSIFFPKFFSNLSTIENFDNKYSIHCINLEKDKDRWNFIKKQCDILGLNVNRFNAIDTTTLSKVKKYKNNFSNDTWLNILNAHSTGKRKYHSDLTFGAIGCYLSHTTLWNNLLSSNDDFYLILEDDIRLPINFNSEFKKVLDNQPKDWDIIFLGYKEFDPIPYNKMFNKMNAFWGMYGMMVNKRFVQKVKNKMFPIKYQIDSFIRLNSKDLNLYGVKNSNFISPASGFNTNIQINLQKYYKLESSMK